MSSVKAISSQPIFNAFTDSGGKRMLRSRTRILGLVLLSVSIGYGSFASFLTRALADERVLSAPSKDPGLILRVATWGGPYEAGLNELYCSTPLQPSATSAWQPSPTPAGSTFCNPEMFPILSTC